MSFPTFHEASQGPPADGDVLLVALVGPAELSSLLESKISEGVLDGVRLRPGRLALPAKPVQIASLAALLEAPPGPSAWGQFQASLIKADHWPTEADLAGKECLPELIGRLERTWLEGMIRQDRFVTHFQPIVCGHDPSRVFAHECLLRGVELDGTLVPPNMAYEAARRVGLLPILDRAARHRSIRGAAEHLPGGRFFVNFNPNALVKPAKCLASTIRAVEQAGIPPARIVFEVVESDRTTLDLSETLAVYRDAGFRVALDNLGGGYASLNLVKTLKPDVIKLDRKLIHEVDRDPYRSGLTRRLVELAHDLGISTVAEGIETEEELAWVVDRGVDFVQGYFIARPACPPLVPSLSLMSSKTPRAVSPSLVF